VRSGIKRRTGTLDIREDETPKPETESGKITVVSAESRAGEERTCGSGFHRDSSRESKEPIRLKGNLNDP
jgi:hypothetical protein